MSKRGSGKYRTIVADPPWAVHQPPMRYETGVAPPPGEPNRPLPYPTMSVEEIEQLPVRGEANESAHLYLWTINRYVEASYAIARAWGFEPSTLLTWCKAPMGLGPGGAFALTSEFCLFARRGKGAFVSRHDRNWWTWPRGRHSAKPDAFLDIVEQVSPGPYLELFARRARFGWDYWGDESLGTAELVGTDHD
jgi:N6-adenosine-specific RNA methylase IME4